jgi:hypothetical protein
VDGSEGSGSLQIAQQLGEEAALLLFTQETDVDKLFDLDRNHLENGSVSYFELNPVGQRGGSGPDSASFL